MNAANSGIGMTSQRTRMRMVERLRGEGITDEVILAVMGEVPRHIFVDEALASRAYEDMALPLGFVDVKVCAVNEVWSGLKLVVRKALR